MLAPDVFRVLCGRLVKGELDHSLCRWRKAREHNHPPGRSDLLPDVVGERLVLRRAWMKAIAGQPAVAAVGFTADRCDVGKPERAGRGCFLCDVVEGIDSRAKVTGRAEGSGTWQR